MPSARKILMDIIEPTIERQYGGGLDDAYMTLSERRRRSSAFADPDATSAFANGGLPTIYRQDGGDFGYYGDITQDAIDAAMDTTNDDLADAEAAAEQYDWEWNVGGGYDYDSDPATADLGVDEYGVQRATPQTGYKKEELEERAWVPEKGPISSLDSVAQLLRSHEGLDWLTDAGVQAARQGENLGLDGRVQKAIDLDRMRKAGVPIANRLEQLGLATFGKGMRGPWEAYTPGDAVYRYKEDAEEVGSTREGYDPQALTGGIEFGDHPNKEAIHELRMYLRAAKPGETLEDVTNYMKSIGRLSEESIDSAARSIGYSSGSAAQASQISNELGGHTNPLAGLALAGSALISPWGFGNQLSRVYGDKGKETSMMGDIKSGLRSLGERFGIIDPEVEPEAPGMPEKLKAAIQNQQIYSTFPKEEDNYLANKNLSMGSLAPDPKETTKEEGGLPSVSGTLEFLDNPLTYFTNKEPVLKGVPNNPTLVERQIAEALKEKSAVPSKEESTTAKVAPEQKSTSFFDTVVNFFKSSGSSAIPDESTNLGPNDAVERKRVQTKPTQKEVAAIAQEAAKIPEEVQKTITSAGLLPQYLALIRAGYTAERAIAAIGLPAGIQIG